MWAKRYRVLGPLGEGGMGNVWRVYDTLSDKVVALKKIDRERQRKAEADQSPGAALSFTALSNMPGSIRQTIRFKMEFRSMSKLKHPNTMTVLDFGFLEDGTEFMTMELILGQGLGEILKLQPLTYPEIYRILTQLCQVLNFIHSRNMVHRDLKPSNIRVTPEGNIKLMDFGLMQQMGLPSNGQIAGTVYYIPPETVTGGIIDARSDLYSLGALAYELVAGQPPFQGIGIVEVIKQHLKEKPKPLCELRPDVPEGLERLISKLLAKDQNDRYESVPDLWEDLTALSGQSMTLETKEQKRSYLNCSQLIGRETEMEALSQTFEQVRKGEGRSLFLSATAGMGKSRLIQEFGLKVLLAEIPFLVGHCTEQGMGAYQPFLQTFQTLLHWTDQDILKRYGTVLVKIVPQLANAGFKPTPALDPASDKLKLHEAVAEWLKAVSQKTPLVFCLEDIHWADPATLELLNALIRECKSHRVFFLATFRSDEVENTSLLLQSQEEELTTLLPLKPLNEAHVQAMVENMLGKSDLPQEFAKEAFRATAGNPYFVSETMRFLIEEDILKLIKGRWHLPVDVAQLFLPSSIQTTILKRLKRLSQKAYRLAQIASVMGRTFDLTFLRNHSGHTEEQLLDILDELVDKQFITRSETHYNFVHDRVRETLYQELRELERRKIHEEIGQYLEKIHTKDLDAVAAELAHHFTNGISRHKAAQYSLKAGLSAYRQSALVEATRLLKEGIEILESLKDYPDKEWWLLEAREKLYMAALFYDGPLCAKTCDELLRDLHRLAGGEKLIRSVVRVFRGIFKLINLLPRSWSFFLKRTLNRPPKPYPLGKSNFAKLASRLDFSSILARIITCQSYYITVCPWAGDFQKPIELNQRNLEYFPDPTGVFRAASLSSSSVVYLYQGRLESLKRATEEAIVIFQENKNQLNRDLWYLFAIATGVRVFRDCWGARKDLPKAILELCQSIVATHNIPDVNFWLYHFQTIWHIYHGRRNGFLEFLEKEAQISRKLGKPAFMETWRLAAITLDALQNGDFGKTQQALGRWDELMQTQKDYWNQSIAEECKGRLAMEQGETEVALKHFQIGLGLSRENCLETLPTSLYRSAEIFIELGRHKEAQLCLEEARALVEDPEVDNPYRQIYVYRLFGLLELKKNNKNEAEQWLNKALALCEECGNEFESASTHFALAQYFLKLENRSVVDKHVGMAKTKFQSIGNSYQIKKIERWFSHVPKI